MLFCYFTCSCLLYAFDIFFSPAPVTHAALLNLIEQLDAKLQVTKRKLKLAQKQRRQAVAASNRLVAGLKKYLRSSKVSAQTYHEGNQMEQENCDKGSKDETHLWGLGLQSFKRTFPAFANGTYIAASLGKLQV